MAIRFAAASGLALAAALVFAAPAGAQSFFSFYEMSPRQIVGMLADDGYELRAPMLRRGDVYVADVTSVSGRSVRLIVSARDGHVVERFASAPRVRQDDDEDVSRFARTRRYDEDPQPSDRGSRGQMALGDIFNPPSRVYGNDSMFGSKPTPPSDVPDDATPKPKHHVAKKHKEPSVAKTSPGSDAPKLSDTSKSSDPSKSSDAPKPAEPSVAAVAPNPAPEPKKPAVEPVKPAPAGIAKPAETATKPVATPEAAQAKADENRATAEPAAPAPVRRVDAPRKKLNDLPVGTLD